MYIANNTKVLEGVGAVGVNLRVDKAHRSQIILGQVMNEHFLADGGLNRDRQMKFNAEFKIMIFSVLFKSDHYD